MLSALVPKYEDTYKVWAFGAPATILATAALFAYASSRGPTSERKPISPDFARAWWIGNIPWFLQSAAVFAFLSAMFFGTSRR